MCGRSSPNDRWAKLMARRKVRTPQGRVLHNVESRRREGKCNRKQTAPHFLRGKGETVR